MKKFTQILSVVIIGSLFTNVAWTMASDDQPPVEDKDKSKEIVFVPQVNPLSASMIIQSSDGTDQAYRETTEILKSDTSKTRIHLIVSRNNPHNWEALVNRGYQLSGFTEQDLQWVVDEFSAPYHLSQEQSTTLFNLMITKQFGSHYEEDVTNLLMSPKLVVADAIFAKYTSRTQKTLASVITHAIERAKGAKRYLEALKNILTLLPIAEINSRVILNREEYNSEKGSGYFDYQYDPKTYTLLGWLTRANKGVDAFYLDKLHKRRDYYVGAAKLLMERNLANKIVDGERDISAELFAMITLLRKQDDVSQEQLETAARRLK